jgi:hypothetical protein
MFSDRSCGWLAVPAAALALALGGCGGAGGGDLAGTSPAGPASTRTTRSVSGQPRARTADRGARRCTRAAFLAALLADVDRLAFKVDRVRCEGGFARVRFVLSSCPAQAPPSVGCDRAKVAAWRLGSERWRLITYADALTCAEIRRSAKEFPSALCR